MKQSRLEENVKVALCALPGAVPEAVKEERRQRFMEKQAEISARLLAEKVGDVLPVIIDSVDADSDSAIGRTPYDAPEIDGKNYRFTVKTGTPPAEAKNGTKVNRGNFSCLFSNTPIPYKYIDDEANAGKMGVKLMAIVAEGKKGRIYLSPTEEMEKIAHSAKPDWEPETPSRGTWASNAQGRIYGFKTFGDYFTPRQLLALTTFSDLIGEAREKIAADYRVAHPAGGGDDPPRAAGGSGAQAYADAVAVYLAFTVDRCTDFNNSVTGWRPGNEKIMNLFSRQAIPMVWDYGEANIMANVVGGYETNLEYQVKCLLKADSKIKASGFSSQADAQTQSISQDKIISTDPPYYDNIGYADLSDFFYVWLRRNLRPLYPQLFAAMTVPKEEELVATPYRHGGKEAADGVEEDGALV